MRTFVYLLIVLCVTPALWGQEKQRYQNLQEAIQSGGQLSGRNGPASVNWIDGGARFSFLPPGGQGVIKTYNPANDTEETAFSPEGLNYPGTDKPFKYGQFTWSADFKYLMFQTNFRPVYRNSGEADYYLYSMDKKSLELVAKDARTAELSPDGKLVAYERGGNIYVFDLAKKKERQLTKDAQTNFYNGRFGWVYEEEFGLVQAWAWSPDSRYIAFWQTDEREIPIYQMTDFAGMHPEYTKIPYPRVGDPVPPVRMGIIDVAKGKNKWVDIDLAGGYFPRIYWTSAPGQLALVHLNRKQNDLTLYFADAATGKARKIMEEKDEDGWIDIFDFFAGILDYFFFPPDAKEFYWISGRDNFNHIYRYDYTGKLLNQVTNGNWDVVRVENVDTKQVLIYYTSTEVSPLERQLYSVKLDGTDKQRITKEDGRHKIDMSPNSQYYIDTHSSVTRHKKVELHASNGSLVKVFEANEQTDKFLETHVYAPRELITVNTENGGKIDVYLVKPLNLDPQKKYPLVLTIYGGPGAQSVYNEYGSSGWEQWLAQNGYAVASVNNRGSGGYGQKFMESVYEKLGVNESEDFIFAARGLATLFRWIDSDRMAIQGHSYGGFTSSYTMVTHPGVFKVALVGAPVTDQRLYDNIYTERYMGLLPENDEKYKNSAPTTFAKNLDGKMLLVHSLMDDNVHVANTFQFLRACTDAGKDVDVRIYPPGNHGVAYSFKSYVLLQGTYYDYLEEHLAGHLTK